MILDDGYSYTIVDLQPFFIDQKYQMFQLRITLISYTNIISSTGKQENYLVGIFLNHINISQLANNVPILFQH